MTLILEVSPETVLRVERATAQGLNIETLLCGALEQWNVDAAIPLSSPSLAPLAGKYEGEAWEELLAEIEKNRRQNGEPNNERFAIVAF